MVQPLMLSPQPCGGYGTGMDMEGVVLESGGRREIHLVQARPIVGP